jgi:UTP--glucose-1-phosphate uridylyltransferase
MKQDLVLKQGQRDMPDNIADFAPFEVRMRQEGLAQIVIDNFRHYYGVLAGGSVGLIPEGEIAPVESARSIDELARYQDAGRQALRHAAVLKLNGGLGTSMGLDKAKSLLVVRDGLTFLDIIARQTISYSTRYDCQIPLILMNSFNTDADSQAALEHYPALRGPIPNVVMQNKVPKIRQDTFGPVEWPDDPQQEWCPPGHGEVYIVLATSGMLDALLARGYEYLFISNSDNLGATLDLGILGYLASERVPFLMEVADRTEADKKGGHIAQLHDGQLILREVAQCPEQDLPAFQDISRHRYFNTNNIWVNLVRLKQLLEANNNVLKLPMIRNAKTVDPKDTHSPAVYQLETAMGAAIGVFAGAQVLRVGRDRFMPVKTCEDLLRLRSDIYSLDQDYQLRAKANSQMTLIQLDSRYYKRIADFEERFAEGAPSLYACAQLAVQGDVCFGAGVVCRGVARIVNRSSEQRQITAGTVIANTEVDLVS